MAVERPVGGLPRRILAGGYLLYGIAAVVMASLGMSVSGVNFFTAVLVVIPALIAVFAIMPWQSLLTILLLRASVDNVSSVIFEGVTINVNAVLSIGVIIGVTLYFLMTREWPRGLSLTRPFALFIFVISLSLIFSTDAFEGAKDILRVLSIFAIYLFIASQADTSTRVKGVLYTIAGSAVLPIMVGLYQIRTGSAGQFAGFWRISGTFTGAPGLAWQIMVVLPVILLLAIHTRSKSLKVALGFFGLIALVAFVFTFTRVAWVGLGVELLILSVVRFRRVLVIGPIVAVIIFSVFADPLTARLLPGGTRLGQEARTTLVFGDSEYMFSDARVAIWSKSWRFFEDSPVFGQGIGSFARLSGSVYLPTAAHSDYLAFAVEAGIIGLAAYIWLMYRVFVEALRALKVLRDRFSRDVVLVVVSVFSAIVLGSFFHSIAILPSIQWYIWSLAALVPALTGIEARECGEEVVPSAPA